MSTKKELLTKFINELKLRNYADNSIESYVGYLVQFLNYMNGKGKIDPLKDIKNFLLSIENMNTRKMYIITIRNFYKYVLKIELSLEDIPYPRTTNYLPQVLSVQEVSRLMLTTTNIKHRAILQLMYSCALRIGEIPEIIVNNKECHIDSNRKLLFIKNAKGFKDRYVPIPEATITLLRNYNKEYGISNWLFMGQNQQKYSVRSIQQIFKNAAQKAGIYKKVTPHSLRHSRLTHLCEAGMDIYKLKELAGHSNIKTTEIYLHLSKASLVKNVEMFDRIIEQNLCNKEFLKELAA
jgi:integrase/recombinase XerD